MNDEARQTFINESEEMLQSMEDSLLQMEQEPENAEYINSVFRSMHTIKGAAGIFGFDFIVDFAHPVETVMDEVRDGAHQVDEFLIAWLLKCKDHTEVLIHNVSAGDENNISQELINEGEKLIAEFSGHSLSNTDDNQTKSNTGAHGAVESWVISLDFKKDTFRNGFDPLSFIRYLEKLGDIREVITDLEDVPFAEEMDPESCYLSFKILLNSSASKAEIESVFEFVLDDCDIQIIPPKTQNDVYLNLLETLDYEQEKRLGEILVSIGAITDFELKKALAAQDHSIDQATADPTKAIEPLGEILIEKDSVSKPVLEKALDRQKQSREENKSIRVDANRLGQLINLVGELVISNAAVKLMVEKHGLYDVQEVVAEVENLVEDIRDNALELRMVPIGETFSRFRRVVRDVSRELGKDIDLVITGGEAELDKTVVEKINDPLTHLVRNSLDHGIETPEERELKGKPRQGTLTLNALHDSGHIVIQIADDGAGLDAEKIRTKAEANGLIQPGQQLSKRELFRLIFEPGLSTKQQASNLSGRGVGMDVVKRNIEALRGNVEVDSEPGKGTLVTIQLPLTLAIIDGFMVGASRERYVIPLSMVEECVEMDSKEWELSETSHYVNLRGEVMPYLRLTEFFSIPTEKRLGVKRESLVVVRFGRNKAGFVVDELYGELQTVIKPLGKLFENLTGVTGATVLGSGEVALILDVQGLIALASSGSASKKIATDLAEA